MPNVDQSFPYFITLALALFREPNVAFIHP